MGDGHQIKIGISACLLGGKVRWDGNHKQDRFLTDTLGKYVEYAPVCPEMECGMGAPREPVRLVGDPSSPRLMTVRTHKDLTAKMQRWAEVRLQELESEGLSGYIFKSGSPSSGMARVKVFSEDGKKFTKKGSGVFARMFMDHFPQIPVEDDGRLHDMKIRENFIERVFTFKKWRDTRNTGKSPGALVAFHTRQKLLILSHSEKHYREMGRLVATVKHIEIEDLFDRYETQLMEAMKLSSTIKKHVNVMQHIMGYFKKLLSPDEKAELMEIIDAYRQESLPLIAPITLLNHYVRKYEDSYLAMQSYLNPHPIELKLRNHV